MIVLPREGSHPGTRVAWYFPQITKWGRVAKSGPRSPRLIVRQLFNGLCSQKMRDRKVVSPKAMGVATAMPISPLLCSSASPIGRHLTPNSRLSDETPLKTVTSCPRLARASASCTIELSIPPSEAVRIVSPENGAPR